MTIANLRALIGRNGGDRPSSLHTRRWRPKGPKKISWIMKSLHGVLHGGLWIRFYGLLEFSSHPPPYSGRPWFSFYCFFHHDNLRTYCRANSKTVSRTDKPPSSSSLKLVGFDTYYIEPNRPLFFPPTEYAMVLQHGPFSLHTMFEGPWLRKTTFPTPMVRPLDESQESSPLQGHGSWLMCEVALRPLTTPKESNLEVFGVNKPLLKKPWPTQ